MNYWKKPEKPISVLCFALLLSATAASACSDLFMYGKIPAVSEWAQSGRNLDCDVTLSPVLTNYPAQTDWTTKDSSGKVINLNKNKYSFVGVSILGKEKKFVDGMNSEGLSASLLWMEDAKFPATATGDSAIAMSDLVAWLLGNFDNVENARKELVKKTVWFDSGVFPYPAHLVIHDTKRYGSLVVEWIDGTAKPVYIDSNNGYNNILTNGPSYKEQLNNLKNFKDLSKDPQQMTGLPGDQTSMSRFVRLSVLFKFTAQYVVVPDTLLCFADLSLMMYGSQWTLQQMLNLMNRVAIIHGEAVHTVPSEDTPHFTHTQLTLVRDHLNKKIYYRFNTDVALKMALVKKSSGTDIPQILDSAASPKAASSSAIKSSPSAFPSIEKSSDSLALDVYFPSIASGKDAKSAKFFIFAKSSNGGIMLWKSGGGCAESPDGRLYPLEGVENASTRIFFSDDFLMNNPGIKVFAGSGISELDMLTSGNFTQIFQAPDKTGLEKLPELKNLLRSKGL